ncbi:serine palmitoyltransferase 1-like [Anneissia japonica]|uniref:serine palmitoyltransferase 1-like n=1 Tax=Anneissia japonica TaxID=1529436 RepID=UPI0014257EA2|nr:serine palmitoyltransferase 1-like [Anneissia japonica]
MSTTAWWPYFGPEPWDFRELFQAFFDAPNYHVAFEVVLIMLIIWLLLSKSYVIENVQGLSKEEEDNLIEEWTPEPLVPDTPEDHPALHFRTVTKQSGPWLTVDGKKGVNLATFNFLGMVGREEPVETAIRALGKYGVGSCGPRGFFGTMDVHLELEKELASFLGVQAAVLYSYGFSTIASAIPSYSKRGDVIFCDKGVNFAIQMGLLASRSTIHFYNHNDMDHLEALLQNQAEEDKKNPKKAKVTRRFIVTEALFVNYGDIAPLPKLVEFKFKYKVRIFLEESLSFGVLGNSGKGLTEYYNIPVEQVDLICASLENSFGTTGGFCAGTQYVVDHQVLSGSGYCFSASLPPLLASSSLTAIELIKKEPEMFKTLQRNTKFMHQQLNNIPGLKIIGDEISPVQHLCLEESMGRREDDIRVLQTIVDKTLDNGAVLTVARYLDEEEFNLPQPSIRVAINCTLTDELMLTGVNAIKKAVKETLSF